MTLSVGNIYIIKLFNKINIKKEKYKYMKYINYF